MSDPPGWAGWSFRMLLLLYPRTFRRAYGEEMAELFQRRLARAREEGGEEVLRLWTRSVWDLVRTAAAERFRRGGSSTTTEAGMGGWLEDTRHAARRLIRTPLFSAAAVAILAVGIGANATAFAVVDAALFRPPPFADPDEVVLIYQDSDDGEPSSTAYPAYLDMAAVTDVFEGVAAVSPDNVMWEAADGPRQLSVEYVTASLFPVLGLQPSRGRWFSPEHDQPGAGGWAVLGHRAWLRELGGDPSIVGSTIRLNGQPVTVIGIGPEDYNGLGGPVGTDLWLSISSTYVGGPFRVTNLERREDHWYQVTARLADGVTLEAASSAMDALALRMGEQFPELDRGRGITVFGSGDVRYHPELDGVLFSVGAAVLVVVGMVLLLACSNLANLLLVRGVSRTAEMAVRQALGAGRRTVARLFLLEALLLSLAGGVAAVLLARWALALLPLLPIPLPGGASLDVGMDARVLVFSLVLVLATSLFFGLAPALRVSGVDVAGALREEARSSSGGKRVSLIRNGLVGIQVAVSLVLVVGAALLSRSLSNVRGVDPGVDAQGVAVMGVNPGQSGLTGEDAILFMEELERRAAAIPGVTHVSLANRLPVQGGGTTTTVVEGYAPPSGTDAVELAFAIVSPDYFEALGVELLDGRMFTPDDRPETQRVVLVNETAARRFWGGQAVGRRMRSQGSPDAWREVVGVVSDTKVSSLSEGPTPLFYFSARQARPGCCYLMARTEGDGASLVPALREVLREVRPEMAATRLGTLETHLGDGLAGPRAAAALMGVFSLLALVLATLGIYAVVSFAVARRASELGIRIALGAARSRVVSMVLKDSLVTVAFGIAAGLGIALLAAPRLEGALFQVGALDVGVFLTGAGVLLLVALLASGVPALRAARSDPVEVLRAR